MRNPARQFASMIVAAALVALSGILFIAPGMAAEDWMCVYDGPDADVDEAQAIVIDHNGDVIVTGYSHNLGTAYDYATIKYSKLGLPLWTNRYDGPVNGTDIAASIAVDSHDNIIVTGTSAGWREDRPLAVENFVTIKYSAAGAPLWTNRYSGPFDFDHAMGVGVDASDNIFVTGGSSETDFPFFRSVYTTLKYSPEGALVWQQRHPGTGSGDSPSALAVDTDGNVVVTGGALTVSGHSYYLTLKYSNAGVPLWTNRYASAAFWQDVAKAVVIDANNDVTVTGYSYRSTNYGNADYLTVKYSCGGFPLWTNRCSGGISSNDFARALAVDRSGNVIVTGESHNETNRDFLTVAYSSGGLPLWTNRYHGTASGDDGGHALAVNGSNVVVAGSSAIIVYSNAGTPLWTGDLNRSALLTDVAVAPGGAMFATGFTLGGLDDYITIKYPAVTPASISVRRVHEQLLLSWNDSAFALQSAFAVTGPYSNVSGASSPYTNQPSSARQFFRLISNPALQQQRTLHEGIAQ